LATLASSIGSSSWPLSRNTLVLFGSESRYWPLTFFELARFEKGKIFA
jgi:hypothetical protein